MLRTILKKNLENSANKTGNFDILQVNHSYNYASILHLSGMSIVTGLPFINIIIPACLWLAKKEHDEIIDLHGRMVINFQITLTILQLILLSFGTLLISWAPGFIRELLAATRTLKIVFSTAYYLPFNLFTFIPFIFAILLGIIGAIAAYHGKIAPSLFGFKFLAIDLDRLEYDEEPEPTKPTTKPKTQEANTAFNVKPTKRTSFG